MRKYFGVISGLLLLCFLLTGCGNSTSMTSMGEYGDLSKEAKKLLTENTKNIDTKNFYGKWNGHSDDGDNPFNVDLKINKDYIEDLDTGVKVKYQVNKKTKELIIQDEELEKLVGSNDVTGYLGFKFRSDNDKNSMFQSGKLIDKDDSDKFRVIFTPFTRYDYKEEPSGVEQASTKDSSIEDSIEESSTESSQEPVNLLSESDIYRAKDMDKLEISDLTPMERAVLQKSLTANGYTKDELNKNKFGAFIDKSRNVVVAAIYNENEQIERIVMVNTGTFRIEDVNMPEDSVVNPTNRTTASSTSDSTDGETATWETVDKTKKIEVSKDQSSITVGYTIYPLSNPRFDEKSMIFDSSFKVGDSANIYKVELEPNKNGKSKVRFYLEDDRVITEELNQLE